ncbi:MAG: hypothetical protein ACREMN_05150 [Gemmatimonadales bacterium]
MRFPSMLVTTAAVLLMTGAAVPVSPAHAAPTTHAVVPAVAPVPTPRLSAVTAGVPAPLAAAQDVEVDLDDDPEGAWYTNPVWIAIGVIALIVIILLIAMAGRGRNTTVVK